MRPFSVAKSPLGLLPLALFAATPGCSKQDAAPAPAPPAAAAPVTVTILTTADENGYLAPTADDRGSRGGAAEMLFQWISAEKHCAGPLGAGHAAACPEDTTVALSAGDHFSGAAISSYFRGEPTAEVMRRLGYAASALGNNDLDYGRDAFVENARRSGFPYVGANVDLKAGGGEVDVRDAILVERAGAKVGVVGLASISSAQTAMEGRFDGVAIAPYEGALVRAVGDAWTKGVDAVVVLAHECPTALKDIVAKHADLAISLVAGAHCHDPLNDKVGATTLLTPGKHFEKYGRVTLTIDKSKPPKQRVTQVAASVVDVKGPQADGPTAAIIAGWQKKLDVALGEEIGTTKKGFAKDAPELAQWVTKAIREELGVDVVILNKKGLRGGLPAGPIKKSSVYTVLPFDNSLMIVSLTGAQLLTELGNGAAIFAGATTAGKTFKDATGKPIDEKKKYAVATVEYLYFGGDGFHFADADAQPRETGMVWQTPVIEWTKKKGGGKPLEALLK